MSEPVTALGGAMAPDGIASVAEAPLQGMITLRGSLSDAAFVTAVETHAGVAIPQARQNVKAGDLRLCWMSPDELLLLCPYDQTAEHIVALQEALAGQHHLAVNVSDARALFTLSGASARDVLAKLCSVDLAEAAFGAGDFRRTRMAQTPAAFWLEGDVFHIICFRSQAQYVFDLLKRASQTGSEVGFFRH